MRFFGRKDEMRNYQKYNDYELIYMVRENEDCCRDILYDKYFPIIKSIANEFYQKYNSFGYDYDDFVQEGLIAFQKSIVNYEESKDALFYTFAIVCIRRSLLTFCRNISNLTRNMSNKNFISIDEYDSIYLDVKSDINSITCAREISDMLKKVIVDLPFENSCIFELKFNGFTYREIGILLDIPSSSVEFKNRAAKKKVARLIKKYYLEKTV